MRKGFFFVFLAFAALFGTQPAWPEPVEVEVFSDENNPVAGIDPARSQDIRITTYDLGAPERWAAEFSAGLPGTLDQAQSAVMARIESTGLEQTRERLREAYAGHLKAFEYGIERYPAIVFDRGAAVVYGVRDLAEALERYANWRSGRHE